MARATESRRLWRPVHLLAALLVATLLSTLFILHGLPSSLSSSRHRLLLALPTTKPTVEPAVGHYGELLLTFLNPDLPFTVFIPTQSSFESLLSAINRRFNESGTVSSNSTVEEAESNYAVISRVFGFSSVPRRILSGMVPVKGEMAVESISGFRITIARLSPSGTLVVNNLACTAVDIIRESIVIHLVDGVLMDSDFEQSVIPFRDDLPDEGETP